MPVVLLNLNLVKTADRQQVPAVELRVTVKKGKPRSLQDLKTLVGDFNQWRCPWGLLAGVCSYGDRVCLDILVEDMVDASISERLNAKRDVIVKAAPFLVKPRSGLLDD